MASRYERVCLIEKLCNNPGVNVELLAGAVLRDNLENALKCQLKFKVIGKRAAYKVSVSVSCFDENGRKIDQIAYTYEDGPYEPETDCGTDALIGIVSKTAYVEVGVHSAIFDEDIQLPINNSGNYEASISVNGASPDKRVLSYDEAELLFEEILLGNPTEYDITFAIPNKAWIQFFYEEECLSVALSVNVSEDTVQNKLGNFCGTPEFIKIRKILWSFRQGNYSMAAITWVSDEISTNKPTQQTQEKKQGCYVATCVYASYDCPQVWTLRRFRDNTLAVTWYGSAFVKIYYAISPILVKLFGQTKWFKNLWKPMLDRMVKRLNASGVEDTPYNDKVW